MNQLPTCAVAWADPPGTLNLAFGEVHVWRVALSGWNVQAYAACSATLSSDERQRAERYRFDRDRDHFRLARGVLRSLLGRYLSWPPAALRFRYNPYGRPSLDLPDTDLHFNLSHAGELALIALTRGRELGVDVEQCLPDRATMAVARQCFGSAELAMLASLPAEQWAEGFYNGWTRKEALIKARGEGLSFPLTQIAVSLLPNEPARLIYSIDPIDLKRWALQALDPGLGYAAALAVDGPMFRLCQFAYRNDQILLQ
ncbi:MAG: 4'-phosphopantetheinyl transferase superfamily protein [Oscillochloris sp.]|nr:4'-phosphopantetheinyl transferase superfamily protein [Oscillochloris sp.]